MKLPLPARRSGSALRKLLSVMAGIALFLVIIALMGVWALGRFAPTFLDTALLSKSGAHLSVEANATNLYAGRVEFDGLSISNPSRWQEREFLKVKHLALEVDAWEFFWKGNIKVKQAELDIDRVVIAGKADYLNDNNTKDIMKGLKSPDGKAPPGPVDAPPAAKRPFHVDHLRVRVGHIMIISGDGSPERRVIVDRAFNFVFEATDITEKNFNDKVSQPLGRLALQKVSTDGMDLIMDLARERLRKSVTEKLLQAK
jgi:hypothetical protein